MPNFCLFQTANSLPRSAEIAIFNPFSQIDSCKECPHLEYKTNFRAVLYGC